MIKCSICGGNHATEMCRTQVGDKPAPDSAVVTEEHRAGAGLGVGDRVGNYDVVDIIGSGATSEVFLGAHVVLGGQVAVKALRPELHDNPELVRRFLAEARVTNMVHHDHILEILDIGVYQSWQHYIVMEYLQGSTLTALMDGVPWSLDRAGPMLSQVCDALNAAHSGGVVHRDLKPDNIYIATRNDQPHVKIVDFGSARRATLSEGEQRTTIGTVLGTALYMAPEQALGRPVDGRADIYALGVIMFQLATGRLPFEPQTIGELLAAHSEQQPPAPHDLNPHVGLAFESIILSCLRKHPDERFQTMADVGRALLYAQRSPDLLIAPMQAEMPAAAGDTAVRKAPSAPATVRYRTSFSARIELADRAPVSMLVTDISLGGMFVSTQDPLPPVFSHVSIRVPSPKGPIDLTGEVVRLEEQTEGRRGFGVRFDAMDPERTGAIAQVIANLQPVRRVRTGDDPEVARVLQHFSGIAVGDHYAILDVGPDADSRAAREACQRLEGGTDAKKFPNISESQRDQLQQLRARLAEAEEILSDPARRALYDAKRGNFMGVARCIREGLPVEDLEQLRLDYLDDNPEADRISQEHLASSQTLEAEGDFEGAARFVAAALAIDALNIDLQRRFWNLRRRAIQQQRATA